MKTEKPFRLFPHENVGIRTLKDLTKDELIWCVEQALTDNQSATFWFNQAMLSVADKRRKRKMEEDEAKGDRWIELQREYEELLRPYAGKRIGELPSDVIEKGAKLERAIKKAQEEYFATFETGKR